MSQARQIWVATIRLHTINAVQDGTVISVEAHLHSNVNFEELFLRNDLLSIARLTSIFGIDDFPRSVTFIARLLELL